MTTTELLSIFRQEVSDLVAPYLWADTLVYAYIDEAQKQFCRDTYGIADSRGFKVNIVPNSEWYKTDPSILKIRSAVDRSTGRDVPLMSIEKAESLGARFDGSAGPLRALVVGLEKNTVRAWPKPNAPCVVELRTFRASYDVGSGSEFEIDSQHVLPLLNWVKHKAYGVQDSEMFDPKASEKFLNAWANYCAKAKDEQSRANHSAGCVIYGGI